MADMGVFELENGLEIDGVRHKQVVMRELLAGEVIKANSDAERITMDASGEPVIVCSPTLVEVHLMCRRIKCIGEIDGPITVTMLGKLSEADLLLIKSDEMGAAIARRLESRGRDEPPVGGA